MRPRPRFGIAIVAVAILLAAAAPARAASIFGVVTDAVTHAGIEDFEVCAYKALPTQAEAESAPESKFCTSPEPEPETAGEYILGGVPSDSYKFAFLPTPGSKYAPELYDDVQTWNEAEVLDVPTGTSIDAALDEAVTPEEPSSGSGSNGEATTPSVLVAPPTILPSPAKPKPLHCRKGFRKKRVKGKLRCVKIHPARHRPGSRR